jgi:hypothetical protein
MSVQVTQDAELGPLVDLLVKRVKHERGLVIRGVRASGRPQRLPPERRRQLPKQALPAGTRPLGPGHRWIPRGPIAWVKDYPVSKVLPHYRVVYSSKPEKYSVTGVVLAVAGLAVAAAASEGPGPRASGRMRVQPGATGPAGAVPGATGPAGAVPSGPG